MFPAQISAAETSPGGRNRTAMQDIPLQRNAASVGSGSTAQISTISMRAPPIIIVQRIHFDAGLN
jgi:hypothetical protein